MLISSPKTWISSPSNLGEQLDVGRLSAALAGAAELHQRRGELRALDRGSLEGRVPLGELLAEVPVKEGDIYIYASHVAV